MEKIMSNCRCLQIAKLIYCTQYFCKVDSGKCSFCFNNLKNNFNTVQFFKNWNKDQHKGVKWHENNVFSPMCVINSRPC